MTPRPWASFSEEELMRRLAQGEMEPLGELYVRFGSMVRAAIGCFAPVLSDAEIEDVVQDVFLTLGDTAARCREPSKCRSFVHGIALRKARNRRRTIWVRRRLLGRYRTESPGAALGRDDSPEKSAQLKEEVLRVLSNVSPDQREILILHLLNGLSKEEVADALGISKSTVRTRLHRARRTLVEIMEPLHKTRVLPEENR
jgi:RNA polymerase sigma-70 factor, ECF subfamily